MTLKIGLKMISKRFPREKKSKKKKKMELSFPLHFKGNQEILWGSETPHQISCWFCWKIKAYLFTSVPIKNLLLLRELLLSLTVIFFSEHFFLRYLHSGSSFQKHLLRIQGVLISIMLGGKGFGPWGTCSLLEIQQTCEQVNYNMNW